MMCMESKSLVHPDVHYSKYYLYTDKHVAVQGKPCFMCNLKSNHHYTGQGSRPVGVIDVNVDNRVLIHVSVAGSGADWLQQIL